MANPVAFLTISALDFGEFGDFQIESNDLKIIKEPIKARIQALKDLLKSSIGDYFYMNGYGTTQESYIGKGLTNTVQLEIENMLKNAIIDENIFDSSEFNIYSIADENTLYIRIFIFEGTENETTLNLTYNSTTGVTLGN